MGISNILDLNDTMSYALHMVFDQGQITVLMCLYTYLFCLFKLLFKQSKLIIIPFKGEADSLYYVLNCMSYP